MASNAPLRSARLPAPQHVIELLSGDFARAGYDIEDVVVDAATKPPRIVVVADGDTAPDLGAIAALSRSASERLDLLDAGDRFDPYVLEVTSPGVDRPLTAERHFRRARGRKVELTLADGSTTTGRIGELADGVVELVVAGNRRGTFTVREVALGEIAEAVVQVEFSSPSRRELELAGVSPDPAEPASGDSGEEVDA